jgi:hypothetical protein
MKIYLVFGLLGILGFIGVQVVEANEKSEYPVPPPTISQQKFPCMQCHEYWGSKINKRQLEKNHADVVLKHDEEQRWCLDCHDAQDRDKLRLLNQEKLDFNKSYALCGQCHGTIYRDWQAGVHGKRVGSWSGAKLYRLCIHCHDPHRPAFAPIKPEVMPQEPASIKANTQ